VQVILSWDISAEGERWKEIDAALRDMIQPYSWVRPLKNVYVLKMHSVEQRNVLTKQMQDYARSSREKVYFLVSPAMTGGGFNGWLPKDTWGKINERVN
jgi:hypothetical protein